MKDEDIKTHLHWLAVDKETVQVLERGCRAVVVEKSDIGSTRATTVRVVPQLYLLDGAD